MARATDHPTPVISPFIPAPDPPPHAPAYAATKPPPRPGAAQAIQNKGRIMIETVASTGQAGAKPAALEFLAFTLGTEEYGIDIQQVQELRRYEPVTYIAGAPAFIKGVVNLRGLIVPILDLRLHFHLDTADYGPLTVVIVVNLGGHVLGMVVDGVSDVLTLTAEQIKPAPAIGGGSGDGHLIGLATVGQRMLILLDLGRLLAADGIGLIAGLASGVGAD
jgi:purine-binding chemotaxis protein CheW